jgi:VanZ family protein
MAGNNLSKTIWRGRIARYAPLFLWIGVIFFLSSTLGSMSHTSRIIRPLLEWLFPDASAETITLYHAYIRKFAHFTEYAILAFLASRGFRGSSKAFLQKYWYAASIALVVLIASIDEFNQSFNPQRTGAFSDVWLDCFGGIFMILSILAIGRKRKSEK